MCLHRCKNMLLFIISALLVLGFLSGDVEAAKISTGGDFIVGREETIDDDLYIFGDVVTIDGKVTGDAIIFSRVANINGTVDGSLLVFAETVEINGEIMGTARGGANSFYFQGLTERDLMVSANTINASGTIGQDFFGAASRCDVSGSVGRNMRVSMNQLAVDAPVGGEIWAIVNELSFGPEAEIKGKITYTSEKEAVIDNQAVIAGEIERLDPPAERPVTTPLRTAWSTVRPVLSILVASLLMVLIFPFLTSGTAQKIREKPGLSLGVGALVVFVAPLAALILLITVVGIPISFLAMLLYLVLLYLSRIFAGFFLARVVFERFNKQLHPVWTALIGVFVLVLLTNIPYIGWLIHLAAALFAAGAFILYLVDKKKTVPAETLVK